MIIFWGLLGVWGAGTSEEFYDEIDNENEEGKLIRKKSGKLVLVTSLNVAIKRQTFYLLRIA